MAMDPIEAAFEQANAKLTKGDAPAAERILRRALTQKSPSAARYALMRLLAAALLDRDRPRAAEALALLNGLPDDHWVAALRGTALRHCGQPIEAIAAFDRALAAAPERSLLLLNRAQAAMAADLFDLARASAAAFRERRPDDARGYAIGAQAAVRLQDFAAAMDLGGRALALDPDNLHARQAIADSLMAAGDSAQALACLGAAGRSREDLDAWEGQWFMRLASAQDPWPDSWLKRCGPYRRPPSSGRRRPLQASRLRVGYLSPDFRLHPCSRYIEPLLTAHDPAVVDVRCYADVRRPDAVTAALRATVVQGWGETAWTPIDAMTDQAAQERMRQDGLDVLVDLAGYTKYSRVRLLEKRLAPWQVGWLGYPEKTGVADARLVDGLTDGAGVPEAAGERLVRLDGFVCWRPPADAPPPVRPPPSPNRRLTFGSLNASHKLSDACLALWGRVLAAVPQADLFLKSATFDDPWVRATFEQRCRAQGLDVSRLTLAGFEARFDAHLLAYHRIDVALDSIPYNGTTTTFEALWMGVPVVTLAGASHRARVGAAILTRLGLEAWVAQDQDAYVTLAASLANGCMEPGDALRNRLAASVWCDADGFARRWEAALRAGFLA